ncbi:MAG TPA: hypothetical protein VF121_02320 [Thermoanaerobaculia bacterium]|nr:hypothetical protein [Thermoanaerobaculia bacterium]
MSRSWYVGRAAALLMMAASPALAGGAWVPPAGGGDVQFGYSEKTARASWDPRGETRVSGSWHIFRYGYSGAEVGVGYDTSVRYLVLYLDGLEGQRGDMERNRGFSELFLGVKHQLRQGTWPMALSLNVRTSYLYDLTGPYDRHLFLPDDDDLDGDGDDEDAAFKGESPEWRGLLGEDYGLTYLVSRSLADGGWFNLETGYTYRTGNLADEIPFLVELGYPLPWRSLIAKGTFSWVHGIGNDSETREPDDRFGCSPNNCFPDASRMVLGAALFRSLGAQQRWWLEAGYNQWIWGRSSRKYEEPYLSLGRKF